MTDNKLHIAHFIKDGRSKIMIFNNCNKLYTYFNENNYLEVTAELTAQRPNFSVHSKGAKIGIFTLPDTYHSMEVENDCEKEPRYASKPHFDTEYVILTHNNLGTVNNRIPSLSEIRRFKNFTELMDFIDADWALDWDRELPEKLRQSELPFHIEYDTDQEEIAGQFSIHPLPKKPVLKENLYIAIKTYTEGEQEFTSLAIAKITPADLEVIKENTDLVNKSKTAYKICLSNTFFDFLEHSELCQADEDLVTKIDNRIEKGSNFVTILSQQEYEHLSNLPSLRLMTGETQIYSDGEIRGFAYTKNFTPIIMYTEFVNPLNLTK